MLWENTPQLEGFSYLTIRAKEAFLNNIQFYKEENGIWLSDPIPSKYIVE